MGEPRALEQIVQGLADRPRVDDDAVTHGVVRCRRKGRAQDTPAIRTRGLRVADLHQPATDVDADNRLFAEDMWQLKHVCWNLLRGPTVSGIDQSAARRNRAVRLGEARRNTDSNMSRRPCAGHLFLIMVSSMKIFRVTAKSRAFGSFLVCSILFALAGSYVRARADAPSDQVSVEVISFSTDTRGPVGAGHVMHATLFGTAGGHATFSIPGIAEDIRMPETSQGRYDGSWTVVASHNIAGASVVGQLIGPDGTPSPIIEADNQIDIGATPPVIRPLAPVQGETIIGGSSAIICDINHGAGPGVYATMTVDGASVNAELANRDSPLVYRADKSFTTGQHTVKVTATDNAGNVSSMSWQFNVAPGDATLSFAPAGSGSIGISDKTYRALSPGQTATVTLIGPAGDSAIATILRQGITIPLVEVQPGRYTGNFTPADGETVVGGVLAARITRGNERYLVFSDIPISIYGGPPTAPVITHPGILDSYHGSIDMSGTAAPFATVRCVISYRSSSMGILPFGGNLVTVEGPADSSGKWRFGPFSLRSRLLFARDRDTRLTLTAECVDSLGGVSPSVSTRIDYSP
jgi:hypothetical protein